MRLLEGDGVEATSFPMYSNASGELDWKRYAIQDGPGAWAVEIDLNGIVSPAAYTLSELKLSGGETVSVGADLTRYPGSVSTIFYSDLVPTTLVVDLQEHLRDTALLLELRIETKMDELPDLFLMANRELMEEVGAATGVDVGFEDGYFKSFGARPGIYMRTDFPSTVARRLLVHEYVHLVFDDIANGRRLPAWLTEGLSGFYEYDLALSGPRPNASRLRQFSDADEARAAAQAGNLFTLASLDRQSDWNNRTGQEQISLQYAEAYMAVRFLNETYGPLAAKETVDEIGRGFGLPDSIKFVTGLDLSTFESQFIDWLKDWEDPNRAAIVVYLSDLEPILAEQDAILDQRSQDFSTTLSADEAAIRRVSRLTSTEQLVDLAKSLSPPPEAFDLHNEAEEYLGRISEWLTLEFNHANTLEDSFRLAANAMIPEINARDFLLQRSISNLQFIFNLGQ